MEMAFGKVGRASSDAVPRAGTEFNRLCVSLEAL